MTPGWVVPTARAIPWAPTAAVAACAVVVTAVAIAEPAAGWPLGTPAALIATGVAVAAWAPARMAVGAGVVAPVLWFAAARAGVLHGGLAEVRFAWHHHPWLVTTAALTALLIGRHR